MAFRVVSNEEFNQIKNGSAVSNAQPETAPVEENAPTPLQTRGAGQFVSVDDYLSKTGTDVLNMASKAATYDSQMYKDAMRSDRLPVPERNRSTTPTPYEEPVYQPSMGEIAQQKASDIANNRSTDENFQSISKQMQDISKTSQAQKYTEQKDWDKKSDIEKTYLTIKQDYDNLYDMFSKRYDAEMKKDPTLTEAGRQAYIEFLMAKDPVGLNAMQQLPEAEAAWKNEQTTANEQDADNGALDVARKASGHNTYMQSLGTPLVYGSMDTMDWDNSFNQTHTVNGQPVPSYDPVTNYNPFSGNSEVNRLRREAQRKGIVWGSPEFEAYVRERLNQPNGE